MRQHSQAHIYHHPYTEQDTMNMRQHQRRNNYDTERASAAAQRRAQATPAVARPYEPETMAALRLHTQMSVDMPRNIYPRPRRTDFVQRDENGVLKATQYALGLLAEMAVQL